MEPLRLHPHMIQLDTLTWLMQMHRQSALKVRLIDVPNHEWEELRSRGFDLIWLMGIWERSTEARRKSLEQPWIQDYLRELSETSQEVVEASPYAVKSYSPDSRIATFSELKIVRERMNEFGLRLILDFVPNHTATDHEWIQTDPDLYVRTEMNQGTSERFDGFFTQHHKVAFGKDPHLDPWTDTAQLDYRLLKTHQKMTDTLLEISQYCDGVRCDMAMLVCNDVFSKTWSEIPSSGVESVGEFWTGAIKRVQDQHQHFILIGEVYWGLESRLVEFGFDYCYDKGFYDALRSANPQILSQLIAIMEETRKTHGLRFTENHDEERAVSIFGRNKSLAAAVIVWTLPGLRFLQAGQEHGFKYRKPVQILIGKNESIDAECKLFYEKLLSFSDDSVLHQASFSVLQPQSVDREDQTYLNLLAWSWSREKQWSVVVINYSEEVAVARLPMKLKTRYTTTEILDYVDGSLYNRDVDQMISPGMFIKLNPWQVHLFSFKT